MNPPSFDKFFQKATGVAAPYGYQCRLACGDTADPDQPEMLQTGTDCSPPFVTLSLEPMELGLCVEKPFENQPSRAERMLTLRDAPEIGPLRLDYWETLLRSADERASGKNHTTIVK